MANNEPGITARDGDMKIIELTLKLVKQLDRLPTEDEVFAFIFGDRKTKEKILNGKPSD